MIDVDSFNIANNFEAVKELKQCNNEIDIYSYIRLKEYDKEIR